MVYSPNEFNTTVPATLTGRKQATEFGNMLSFICLGAAASPQPTSNISEAVSRRYWSESGSYDLVTPARFHETAVDTTLEVASVRNSQETAK